MTPEFSIIVPTFGRPDELERCVTSIGQLEAPPGGLEVIVVDDGGPVPVDSGQLSAALRFPFRVLRQKNAGPGAARNAGLNEAHGRFVAFTDDDCRPDPLWLLELAAALDRSPGAIVGGKTLNGLDQNIYSAASQLIVSLVYTHQNQEPDNAMFFAANNIAVSRTRLMEIGGFDALTFMSPPAAEDRDLCERWRHRGWKLVFVPNAIVHHCHGLTLHSFSRQHFQYGRGAWRFHRKRQKAGTGTITKDVRFHLALPRLIRRSWPSGLRSSGRVLALLALWQLINLVGFCFEAVRESVSAPSAGTKRG